MGKETGNAAVVPDLLQSRDSLSLGTALHIGLWWFWSAVIGIAALGLRVRLRAYGVTWSAGGGDARSGLIDLIQKKYDDLIVLCRKFNIERLDLFGSAATGH